MLGSEAFKESTVELVTRWATAFRSLHGRALDAMYARLQVRAVATPVRDLSRLFAEREGTLQTLRHLQAVERVLRRRDSLDSVPPAVLKTASEQLAVLSATTRSPGLGMLLLQMRRQIASDGVRGELARTGDTVNWRPTFGARHRTPVSSQLYPLRDSEFEKTVPLDRDEDSDAANDSAFAPTPPTEAPEAA